MPMPIPSLSQLLDVDRFNLAPLECDRCGAECTGEHHDYGGFPLCGPCSDADFWRIEAAGAGDE